MAIAPIRPLAWEPPYAAGVALEKGKKTKTKCHIKTSNHGVPTVVQWDQQCFCSTRTQWVKGSSVAVSCGVGHRHNLDLALLWLRCRPAAKALIGPLACEHPYAVSFALITNIICLFRAAPVAYGGSQARALIRAGAAGLCHSHSHAGSEPRLRPTPQLRATVDP